MYLVDRVSCTRFCDDHGLLKCELRCITQSCQPLGNMHKHIIINPCCIIAFNSLWIVIWFDLEQATSGCGILDIKAWYLCVLWLCDKEILKSCIAHITGVQHISLRLELGLGLVL